MAIQLKSFSPGISTTPLALFVGADITITAEFYEDTVGLFNGETDPLRQGRPITGVQWQVSPNYDPVANTGNWNNIPSANTFTDVGTYNNGADDFILYESSYNTGPVNASNDGTYIRLLIISDTNVNPDAIGDASIPDPGSSVNTDIVTTIDNPADEGFRELSVSANPEILILNETYGDPIKIVAVSGNTSGDPAEATVTYINREIDSADDLDNLFITWYYSFDYDPITDPFGGTWIAINDELGAGTYTNLVNSIGGNSTTDAIITESVDFNAGANGFVKTSTLIIDEAGFDFNSAYFRSEYTSTGVLTSPVLSYNYFQLLINPQIFILEQPGESATDTGQLAYSYGQGNPDNGISIGAEGGDIRLSVNAFSTAGSLSTLQFNWQIKAYSDKSIFAESDTQYVLDNTLNNPTDFVDINLSGLNNGLRYNIISNDNELILTRLVHADYCEFRCVISGTSSELPVVSNTYRIYFRDTLLNNFEETTTSNEDPFPEDFYGDVPNRELLTDKTIRTTNFNAIIDNQFYTGQAGNLILNYQVSTDGGTIFTDIPGSEFEYNASFGRLTQISEISTLSRLYVTPPLRIDPNDGDIYRVQVTSSAVWDVSGWNPGDPKTFIPFFFDFDPLELRRELFIESNPSNSNVFLLSNVSFSAVISITSEPTTIVYQWEWSELDGNGEPIGFTNLTNGEFFATTGETGPTGSGQNSVSGVNSEVLLIDDVTEEIQNYGFRLTADAPGSIGSVSTEFAKIIITEDKFLEITSISDVTVPEFQSVQFEVTASTLSGAPIDFQWQKSVDNGNTYVDLSNGSTGSGSTIFGSTENTLTITGVTEPEDEGLYRLRLISAGGEVEFTNSARINVSQVAIVILEDFDTSNLVFIEEEIPFPPFSILAAATNGEQVEYQWQFRRPGATPPGDDWQNFPLGYDFQESTDRIFTPQPFIPTTDPNTTDDGIEVRCRLSIPSLGTNFAFSSVGTLDIRRQGTYQYSAGIIPASSFNGIVVEVDTSLQITLNPEFTGSAAPTYQWQWSSNGGSTWNSISSLSPNTPTDGFDQIFFSSVPNSWNGYLIRCQIDLELLDQLSYVKNGVQQLDISAVQGTGFTEPIQLVVVPEELIPLYYSNETSKSGCPIGTVICVPKPSDFVDQIITTGGDDRARWGVAGMGGRFANSITSAIALNPTNADGEFDFSRTSNQASFLAGRQVIQDTNIAYHDRGFGWINNPNDVKVPTFTVDRFADGGNRFPGFIAMRGQWLYVSEFPLLYKVIGDEYGFYASPFGDKFKLPNPYAKRVMGTGAVDSRSGIVTVIPEYAPNGESGGATNQPGTVGGRYIYERSAQLPPGSPGITGSEDGTAGILNPETFILGNYSTNGWEEIETIVQPNFTGNFTFRVGPLQSTIIPTPPAHIHGALAIGFDPADDYNLAGECTFFDDSLPNNRDLFFGTSDGGGQGITEGPAYIDADDRGRAHTHAISDVFLEAGNNVNANQGEGIGSIQGSATDTFNSEIFDIHVDRNSDNPSINSFVDFLNVNLSTASRTEFDSNLSFYLRNNEAIPIRSDYFRLKWLIKAY